MKRHRKPRFVAETEMAEILANEKLLLRLRTGSAQAAARRGVFVPLAAASPDPEVGCTKAGGWLEDE